MGINETDMKILWSRAAGLCSFQDCRTMLVRFCRTDTETYHIGEMAHLIARSMKGPRGDGALAKSAKDSYENHILLCPTCHAEIDKNPADYPVEKLCAFKSQHEHWVAETLLANIGQRPGFLKFYSDLLRRMEAILQFDSWPWLIDHLWRDLAPSQAIESAATAREILLKTIWPGSLPDLEGAFRSALQAWSDYSINFETACEYRGPDFLVSSHTQPGMSSIQRLKAGKEQEVWSNKNGELLFAYVRELNHMVDAVRKDLNPMYRQQEGYFLVRDDIGYRANGRSVILRPY